MKVVGKKMRTLRAVIIFVLGLSCLGLAQMTPGGLVSSHTPSAKVPPVGSTMVPLTQEQMASKIAIRVNGTGLSELDVRREMVTIFPYATQHNGFPKDMEPQIRKGAVEMIVFEELLYQDAKQRKL